MSQIKYADIEEHSAFTAKTARAHEARRSVQIDYRPISVEK